jgi:two-component system response regulator ArlR
VLVIEDDAWIRRFLCDILADEGYDVIEAADGRTGIRLVDEYSPHMLLLDIAMPGFTGVDVLCHLRSKRRTRNLPVIVVSAFPRVLSPNDEATVVEIITKPVHVEKMLAAVRRALEPFEQPEPAAPSLTCRV